MFISKLSTTVPQIFSKTILDSQVIVKSIIDPDNTFVETQKHEWVKSLPIWY